MQWTSKHLPGKNVGRPLQLNRLNVVALSFAVLTCVSAPRIAAASPVAKADVRTFANESTLAQQSEQSGTSGFGPLDPSPPIQITPAQIVTSIAKRETEFAKAREQFTFRQTVKVDTISEDTNKVDGEYQQVTDIVFSENGKRQEKVLFAPRNTLDRIMMSPADFADIEHRLPFVLTSADLPQYDVTYLGRQRVDELDTYVFQAGPKTLEKGKRYFQGKVWVDQQDFQIVLVNGKSVPDDKRPGHEDLSPPFTTYYEQVDGKYWFPTYTKAEGNLHFAAQQGALSQDVHIRSTVRYTDYKSFRAKSRIIFGSEVSGDEAKPESAPK